MILVGDVGGTKTLLALFEYRDGNYQCQIKQRYASAEFASFDALLDRFLHQAGFPSIHAVSIGVAGPIVEGDCHATNLPWWLNRADIGQKTRAHSVVLINDLEASAWGLLGLTDELFVELNSHAEIAPGNQAVIAAGTGLGEAIMAFDGEKHHILATEGGHADFAPRNVQEMQLLAFMLEKYPDHVSYERLVSGEGLVNIYQFLAQSGFAATNPAVEQQWLANDAAAVIGEMGVAGEDVLCVEAVRWFCRLYGAEAGNLALKCLPYAGVYLAGGIAGKLLPVLQAGYFMEGFLAKGRCRAMLQRFSVKVCLEPEVALLGALAYAVQSGV
jgi:glucokinase